MDPGLLGPRNWTWHFGADKETARQEREEAARRAIELDPSDAEAHAALADVLGAAGKFAQAEAELEKAPSPRPNVGPVLVSYIDRGQHLGPAGERAEMADATKMPLTWARLAAI
jgi:Tfp pilus assembly protein PilF